MTDFYTREGDNGYTGLLGAGRVAKYHPRPEAYGEIDEASAFIGAARAAAQSPDTQAILMGIQRDLYQIMAEVAATPEAAPRFRVIDQAHIARLETQTDTVGAQVTLPHEFILPGDTASGAALAIARTVVRRAERRVVRLFHEGELENSHLTEYLNRLSSLLFVLELFENQLSGKATPTLAKAPDKP
jgi:cob(I)alamin adenosyltransferase